MTSLHAFAAFLALHWLWLIGGAPFVMATIANQYFAPGHTPKWWTELADLLAFVAQQGKVGIIGPVSLPGVRSRVPSPATLPPTHPAAALVTAEPLKALACTKCGAAMAILLGILIGSIGLSGCATIPTPGGGTVTPAQYASNYETCLKNEGITQAMPEVAKIWNILDQAGPNASSTAIEGEIETAALTLSGDAAVICIDCTIIAWDASNPVPPNVAPTPAQAAVRLYKAKYRSHAVIAHARATAMRDRKAAERAQEGGAQ